MENNQTKALLLKYQSIIGGLLKVAPTSLTFMIRDGDRWQELASILDTDKASLLVDWNLGEYRLQVDTGVGAGILTVASWQLYQLPHCCGVCVSCKALVEPAYRGRGVGVVLNNLRQEIARHIGYSLLMCTDVMHNEPQRKVLSTNGWKDIFKFINRRTGNTVAISVVNI